MKNQTLIVTNILTAVMLVIVSALYIININSAKTTGPTGLCTNTCFSFNPPSTFQGVNGTLAKALVENYRTHQWKTYRNLGPTQLPDTRAVWFSVERLKHFLYEIEQSACASKCNMSNMVLGVRVYYGTYPEKEEWRKNEYELVADGIDPNYAGTHTVVFVPTFFNGTKDVDFDPKHWIPGQCQPMPMDSVFNVATTTGFMVPTKMPNHGGPKPPPYDGRVLQDGSIDHNVNPILCDGTTFMKVVDGMPFCTQ
jgi:hypothetical protein